MRQLFFQNRSLALLILVIVMAFIATCTHPFSQGRNLYNNNCSRCHGTDGDGLENLFPGLKGSPYLTTLQNDMACVIVYGSDYLDQHRVPTLPVSMPANEHLNPVEVLNIINYILWEFGDGRQVAIDEVRRALDGCNPEL